MGKVCRTTIFLASLSKFGQNILRIQKLACSYTYWSNGYAASTKCDRFKVLLKKTLSSTSVLFIQILSLAQP